MQFLNEPILINEPVETVHKWINWLIGLICLQLSSSEPLTDSIIYLESDFLELIIVNGNHI